MNKQDFSRYSDEELLAQKKKLKNSKIFYATAIGFLGGILIFGMISWFLSADKQLGFLIPMLIPVVFIYKVLKRPNTNQDLEKELKERNLD